MINFYNYYNRVDLDFHRLYFLDICELYRGINPKYNWSKIMHIIKTDPFNAYSYAVFVRRRRWRKVEKCIQTNDKVWGEYKWYFKVK